MQRKKAAARSPRQSRGIDTVRFILDAVDRILRDEGAAAVTVKHVAKVAGVGVGTLYQYFPDRSALLREVERRAWEAELERTAMSLPELTADTLEEGIAAVVTLTMNGVASRVATHGLTMDDPEVRVAHFELIDRASEIVHAALANSTHRLLPTDSRLGVRIAVEAAVLLGWVSALRDADSLRTGDLQREVGAMLARYLVRDART